MRILERILGVPLTASRRKAALDQIRVEAPAANVHDILGGIGQHLTEKSGALLAAQAILVVAVIYALDHSWGRAPVIASLIMLIAAALLVMTNLRSSFVWRAGPARKTVEDVALQTFAIMVSRGLRFNLALYATFVAIALLGAGASVFF
jgi:hypothetical protein